MKRDSGLIVLVATLILGTFGLANAAPRTTYKWRDETHIGKIWQPPQADQVSHIIYLNNCLPNGCTIHPGSDNSATDTSEIVNGLSQISKFAGSPAQWQQVLQCVQQTYAPFGVQVVDQRPASGTPYHMAIVAGRASEAGQGNGTLGVAPFDCGYIPNAVSYSFANEEINNVLDICWTVSQETAHAWGLDHKFDNRDPMTYLSDGPAQKSFQNQAGSCGEYSSRACSCNYAGTGTGGENSYALIMQTFGTSAPDTTAPTVAITSPGNGASVMPGFAIRADVSDNIGIQKVELRIDGKLQGSVSGAPWVWNAPQSLSQGAHHVELTAWDLANNMAKATVDVSYGTACTDGGCNDPKQVCVEGHCVAGPDMAGGLGTTCAQNADCASGQCGNDGTGAMYCVEVCTPNTDACPNGFGCEDTGGGSGVCWPGAQDGGGGCNTGGSGGAMFVGLGLGAMLVTRRRRR